MATRNSSSCTVMLTGPALTAWGDRKPEGNCAFSLPSGFLSPQALRTGQIYCAEVLARFLLQRELQVHRNSALRVSPSQLRDVLELLEQGRRRARALA